MDDYAIMDERSARDKDFARGRAQEALKEFKKSKRGTKTLSGYLNLVKDYYLPAKIYAEHEDIVTETWKANQRNSAPSAPTGSSTHSSPKSEAIDIPRDSIDHLPSLDPEAKYGSLWVVRPDKMRFGYASYKRSNTPGSFIRADSMRNNNFNDGGNGLVVVQWIPCGRRNNDDDHVAKHTAFRIINEEKAKNIGMNVDLILGTDCGLELRDQHFAGDRTRLVSVPTTLESLNSMLHMLPQSSMLSTTGATSSSQQSGSSHARAHLSGFYIAFQFTPGPQLS